MELHDAGDYALVFGPFRLFPARQLLLEGEREIRLGSRALAILTALAERAGELVSKEEFVRHVWPDTFVEEANLRVHVAALRRALGRRTGSPPLPRQRSRPGLPLRRKRRPLRRPGPAIAAAAAGAAAQPAHAACPHDRPGRCGGLAGRGAAAEVYGRFTEGLDSADCRAARELFDTLQP